MRKFRSSKGRQALSDGDGLLKAGGFSLCIHVALAIVLTLSGRSLMTETGPSTYRVIIRPYAPHGDGGPLGSLVPGRGGPSGVAAEPAEKPKSVEKPRTVESKRKEGIHAEKREKSYERSAKQTPEGLKRTLKKEDLDKQKSYKHLQEALEEIKKKAALDRIKKRVTLREEAEREAAEESGSTRSSQEPGAASSGRGSGSGSGTGTGSGSIGSPTGGSPWGSLSGGSSEFASKENDYYNMIWAKIKQEWALPGDLPKGGKNLETVIVIVIERNGKIRKSWFEKKSGNAQYDQMAMRAIKKADPLPAIPKEFSDETFEVGIRFHPE